VTSVQNNETVFCSSIREQWHEWLTTNHLNVDVQHLEVLLTLSTVVWHIPLQHLQQHFNNLTKALVCLQHTNTVKPSATDNNITQPSSEDQVNESRRGELPTEPHLGLFTYCWHPKLGFSPDEATDQRVKRCCCSAHCCCGYWTCRKTPMRSKYYCLLCFEHTMTVPITAIAPALALATCLFPYQVSSMWNKLPLEIHNSSSFASFKRNLNTYYFSRAFS